MKVSKITITVLLLTTLLSVNALTTFAQTTRKPAAQAPSGDIKIRVRTTISGQSFESTQSIKGARQRDEMNIAGGLVNLMQCDLKRAVQINEAAKTYLIQPFADAEPVTAAGGNKATAPATGQKRGGVVTYVYTTTDTGERKEMFGFTARRIKTSMTTESTPDACNQTKMKMDTDGWYIDLDYGIECQNKAAYSAAQGGGIGGCQDTVKSKTVGNGKLGFPLDLTTTFYNADGTTMVSKREVLELSRTTLAAEIFDVPAGYTEVKDFQQLMSGSAGRPATAGPNAKER